LPDGTLGMAYLLPLAATGGTMPYVWALSAGAFPAGLTMNGAGVISGTPTKYGSFAFTVRLTDYAGLSPSRAFSISVSPPPLVITTGSPMPDGRQGSLYSQALTAVGGVAPYSWSVAGGALPPGLSLDALGDFTGTPTTQGTFNFTAQVTDNVSNALSKALAITILPPTLKIATDELPDSTVGAAYSQTLAATGGTMPYTWSLVWGALPGGLSLSSGGLLSGTPTNGGTFSFIVQVADQVGTIATEMFTVGILNNTPTIGVDSFSNGTITLLISGDPGPNYAIEASTNLVDWEPVFTTNAPAMPFHWSNPGASNSATFYRALVNP
jgi:large repetitive protein